MQRPEGPPKKNTVVPFSELIGREVSYFGHALLERLARYHDAHPVQFPLGLLDTAGGDEFLDLCSVQQVIDILESRDGTEELLQGGGFADTTELASRLMAMSRRERTNVYLSLGIGYDDLIDKESSVRAFFSVMDTPEGVALIDEALKKKGF